MRKEEHEILFNVEDDYWWYVGLRGLVLSFIDGIYEKKERLKILDAGCGTGKMLESCGNHKAYGLDFSKEALQYCKLRKLNHLLRGSISALPFKNDYFNLVISLDVIGQGNKLENDVITLKEIYRVIAKEGILLLNLPAYKLLRSKHDEAVSINIRYTIKELKSKLQKAGFEIEQITYRNTILFPIAVIKRIIDKISLIRRNKIESDLKPLPYLINQLFKRILFFENKLIRSGINFPFGLSIYCIARKKGNT
ncbi:MAG: class I SAM-dependent methyltransferase [Nitrospirae bacterium]|nr:class I SAM-dependent methyltransferase [Nitrospirota bacterium]